MNELDGAAWLCGVLLCAALSGGCAAAPPGPPAHAWTARAAPCGASVAMPAPMRVKRAQEGEARARIAWGVDADGSRYEVACFELPEPLDDPTRAALLARIERGIAGRPDAREATRRSMRASGWPAVELELAFSDDRRGRWWIFMAHDRRIFEVSVVGPPGDRLSAGAAAFFGSFRLDGASP